MKTHLIMTVILFLLMIIFPLITLTEGSGKSENSLSEQNVTQNTTEKEKSETVNTVTVMSSTTNKLTEMSVEDYIYSAVCAEMPASFHTEALKAQAVASYTYMKWIQENADNGNYISDNSAIHQALITEEELKERWGSSYSIYSEKVKDAVKEVLYEYLTYKGETAMTVFHGLSSGNTASAESIWGSPVHYLQSVSAPGDSLSPDIASTVTLTREEFVKAFESAEVKDSEAIYDAVETDDSGLVTEISFKSTVLSPTDIRSAFGLKSPHFKAEMNGDSITFTVYGKGHGVGMSQNSADYMARQGSTYKEILAHFYKDTVLNTK